MPTLFVEAEFHAVWQSLDGSLLDITPKPAPTQKILFLPDPVRSYQGRQVNNIRKPLTQDPVVIDFLKCCDEQFEFLNRGARSEQHGEISVQGNEFAEYNKIRERKERLQSQLLPLIPKIGPNRPCWCGSGKKAKWCHSKR